MNTQERAFTYEPPITQADLDRAETKVRLEPLYRFVNRLDMFRRLSHAPGRYAVSAFRVDELTGAEAWMTGDLLSGFCVHEGSLKGLFSFVRGRGQDLVTQARARDARYLECYDLSALTDLYLRAGFHVTSRAAWDQSLAPADWPTSLGRPDYLTMHASCPGARTRPGHGQALGW